MTKELIHRNPSKELFPINFSKFWREFDNMFRDLPGFQEDGWSVSEFPRTDIIYDEDKAVVELPLAGYTKEQLSVEVQYAGVFQEAHLVISAKKCEDKGCSRRATRAFIRTISIGDGYDLSNVSCQFENGLLRVEIPSSGPKEGNVIKVEIQ